MSERFQREIEEILQGSSEPSENLRSDADRSPTNSSLGDQDSSKWIRGLLVPSRLFLTSGGLLLTALILNVADAGLSGLVFWSALILFIFAYAVYIVRSEKLPERRWRGRVVNYGNNPTWRDRIRGWLK